MWTKKEKEIPTYDTFENSFCHEICRLYVIELTNRQLTFGYRPSFVSQLNLSKNQHNEVTQHLTRDNGSSPGSTSKREKWHHLRNNGD